MWTWVVLGSFVAYGLYAFFMMRWEVRGLVRKPFDVATIVRFWLLRKKLWAEWGKLREMIDITLVPAYIFLFLLPWGYVQQWKRQERRKKKIVDHAARPA